ncbi:MAG TPA: J domain-containing protein [Terriglobia bacterium]|nr:J domain-containing protein [Terriglobia bacterium]
MARDYYELLEIQPEATADEVHNAYRSLAMRYHPDRNPSPGAASMMAVINEAYSILGEPARRRRYDQARKRGESFEIARPILRAAVETLLKRGWIVSRNDGANMIFEQGTHAVLVSLVPRLDNQSLRKIGRQFPGFSVVLAVEIETPINLSFHTAVIDLVHSRHHGAAFPDEVYQALFAPFIASLGEGK